LHAFRRETEHLNAERIPQTAWFFVVFVGATLPLEWLFFPDHVRPWLIFYTVELAVLLPFVAARWLLVRHGWLLPVNVAVWSILALIVHGYGAAVRVPAELLGMGGVCLMTGASMLLPWGALSQSVLCVSTLLAFVGAVWSGVPCSIHAMVLPDGTAVFRPVEIAIVRDVPGRRFVYGGLSTHWDPTPADRETMRDAARRVGFRS